MKITHCFLFFTLFFTHLLLAQTTLQLPLDPGRINPGTDLKLAANGDYLLSSYFPGPILTQGGGVNLTRFNLKDGVLWSQDMNFSILSGGGYVADWPQEQALLMTAFVLDTFYNKVLVKLDPQGNVLWSRRYGKPNDVSYVGIFNGKTLAMPLADGNVLLAGGATAIFSNVDANDLFVGKIGPDGGIVWAKNLCFSCLGDVDAALGNVIPTSDGGFLLTGIVERNNAQNNEDVLLVKLNASGDVQWAKALNNPGSFLSSDDRGFELKELPNGHFVIVGELFNFGDNVSDGLILEVDADGSFLRSVTVQITNSNHEVKLPHLDVLDDNTIVVTGSTSQDTIANAARQLNFLAQIQLNGTVDWRHSWYPETFLGFGTAGNALVRQPGGYAYLINDHENFDKFFPALVLTEENGKTGCEDEISISTITNKPFTVSNLTLTAEPLTFSEDFPVTKQNFNGFNINLPYPDLGPDLTACEPLDIPLLIPQVIGINSFQWSTGSNAPIINATAPGAYAVTVTASDFCLTASDTVLVSASAELPIAAIEFDPTGFCENGFVLLAGTAENADAIMWSTGDTTAFIEATEAGIYTLTVSNSCGTDVDTQTLELPPCDTVKEFCPLEVPNAFSPNNDGINDSFLPVGKCLDLQGYVFKVFSRWGELVFETDSPLEGWNGEHRNKPATSDVYVWFLQYDDGNKGMVKEQGDVTLLR
ncbi:MAG: gliding motility-associated C-terminal domain-containing protein [Lewinellaceae bacterium]|nr:gliding motility-associated C-terminal domain-containing protein [Saprospiraceae bacterium]MCB9339533.1 gliding motility-associated C-terminal domain-containing protein [Lewinellaceae bacterium]